MKRLAFFLVLLCTLCFFGCQGQNYDILSYQNKNISAICTLNDEYKIKVERKNDLSSVSFLEPKELKSVIFTLKNDELSALAGEVNIPLSKENADGIYAILNMFSLDTATVKTAKDDGEFDVLEFDTEIGLYTLLMGENNLPSKIIISGDGYFFEILIDEISLS